MSNEFPEREGGNAPPVNSNNRMIFVILASLGALGLLGVVACGGLVYFLAIPMRAAARMTEDQNNLKQVGLAFYNYESAYRAFPYPYAVNENDEPVWSWRVPLSAFGESPQVWDEVQSNLGMKPWDHPQNGVLQEACPTIFRSARSYSDTNHANVFLVSADPPRGPKGPAMINGQSLRKRDVLDGLSNTLLAIQFANHSAPWADPQTLTPEEAFQYLQQEDEGANVLLFDGSVTFLSKSISREEFDAMISSEGGEVVNFR